MTIIQMWVPRPSSITRYSIRDTAGPLPATASRRLYSRLLWRRSTAQLPCVLGKYYRASNVVRLIEIAFHCSSAIDVLSPF